MTDLDRAQFERRRGIVDMMLTAHSVLRDRYERRATGLTLLVMALSILATGVAFISGAPHVTIGPFKARVQVWVGVLTCLIFLLSIVELLVEWRRRAWAHGEGARDLSDLKGEFRHANPDGAVVHSDTDLLASYEDVMDALNALRVPIPEGQFNRLKARHLRKVAISARITARPERPQLLHRLDLFREGLKTSPDTDSNDDPPAARERP
jgi:hypothetical protein